MLKFKKVKYKNKNGRHSRPRQSVLTVTVPGTLKRIKMAIQSLQMLEDGGSEGRTVASDTRDWWFESSHFISCWLY